LSAFEAKCRKQAPQ